MGGHSVSVGFFIFLLFFISIHHSFEGMLYTWAKQHLNTNVSSKQCQMQQNFVLVPVFFFSFFLLDCRDSEMLANGGIA